jgi:peroxiredoxin
MAAKYKGKDVVFLGLTTDDDSKVKQYIRKKPFDFYLLPNSFGILLKYADKDGDGNVTMGYPSHFLINQTGEIELKTSGFKKTEKLAAQIDKLLK